MVLYYTSLKNCFMATYTSEMEELKAKVRKKGNEGFEWPVIDKKKKRRIMKFITSLYN